MSGAVLESRCGRARRGCKVVSGRRKTANRDLIALLRAAWDGSDRGRF